MDAVGKIVCVAVRVDKRHRNSVLVFSMTVVLGSAGCASHDDMAFHTGFAVTGLAVDIVNKTLISVGADAKLILWNFQTHAPHQKSPYILPCPATKLCHVRDSD